MIKDWREIQDRFDAIKDHKPRAVKKLNELGDILSSAYAINPCAANDMWQYIVDLNIADSIEYSKFYIAQIFNKLAQRMDSESVTAFLCMNPERLRLMIMYGYEGGTLWSCLGTLIRGYIDTDDANGAMVCAGYFYEKFGGIDSGNRNIVNVVRNITEVCIEYVNNHVHLETATRLLSELGDSDNDIINGFVEIMKATHGIGNSFDFDFLFDVAKRIRCPEEFFELLWVARNEYSLEKLTSQWVEYLQGCAEDEVRPWGYIDEDENEYHDSKLKFYVDLEKNANDLLDYYFNRERLYIVEQSIIWEWIECSDWERFVKYVSKAVKAIPDNNFERSDIRWSLHKYMEATFYDDDNDTLDRFDRSYKMLMQGKVDDFVEALAKISALTVDSDAHESYHEFIKDYIQEKNGNLDALNAEGFNEEIEKRTALERLKSYAQAFVDSGKLYDEWNTKYSLIIDALDDQIRGSRVHIGNNVTITLNADDILAGLLGTNGLEDEEEGIDQELEYYYRIACDEDIALLYFKHFPSQYQMRADLISACIMKGDTLRATELIDMMAETEGNPGYEDLNGCGRQNMLTLMYLVKKYKYGKDIDEWDRGADITDEMRESVKRLVYRMLPHLSEASRKEFEEKYLYTIDPKSVDEGEYINKLLQDIEIYTTFPKPRGKGGAQNINRMSEEFINCFERLSKMERLDVVGEIMTKLASVKDTLRPVSYTTWMSFMANRLRKGELVLMYRLYRKIFEAWLECNDIRDHDIIRVAEEFAKNSTKEEFEEFQEFIVKKIGNVEDLDTCYDNYGGWNMKY